MFMRDYRVKKLVMAAMFAALTTVMTMVIQIPSPMQGYVNLGDCTVLLSAWLLGPLWGGAAAGIGSMLADIIAGYTHYALGTLVIKFCMAVAAGLIFKALHSKKYSHVLGAQMAGGLLAETIMVLGYFGYCGLWLSEGLAAAASIPGNVVQGVFGLVSAVLLYAVLDRSQVLQRVGV